jgi:hypothetical protein
VLQNYAVTLAEQLGKRSATKVLGLQLSESQLSALRDDQLGQLFTLFQETQKPVNPDNPLGENPVTANASDRLV